MTIALKQTGIGTLLNGNRSYGIVSGTATGLRISSVDGTAFLDNNTEIIKYIGCRIQIYDASLRYLEGYIGAVGSSEGLGDNPADFATINLNDWITTNATITSNTSFDTTANAAYIVPVNYNTRATIGKLYKAYLKGTGTVMNLYIQGNSSQPNYVRMTSGGATGYGTAVNTFIRIGAISSSNPLSASIESMSWQEVLAPSSSGVTILNAIGGAQNFVSKDASFTYDANSYTYKIWS
jgi:hypothetical protein